jgi:hypothetical protein
MWIEHVDFELNDPARLRRLTAAVEAFRVAQEDDAPFDETDPRWRALFAEEDWAYFTHWSAEEWAQHHALPEAERPEISWDFESLIAEFDNVWRCVDVQPMDGFHRLRFAIHGWPHSASEPLMGLVEAFGGRCLGVSTSPDGEAHLTRRLQTGQFNPNAPPWPAFQPVLRWFENALSPDDVFDPLPHHPADLQAVARAVFQRFYIEEEQRFGWSSYMLETATQAIALCEGQVPHAFVQAAWDDFATRVLDRNLYHFCCSIDFALLRWRTDPGWGFLRWMGGDITRAQRMLRFALQSLETKHPPTESEWAWYDTLPVSSWTT